MTEETTPYERRADHGKRSALLRLRLVEARAVPLLEVIGVIAMATDATAIAAELSAAIDGVVNVIRTPSQNPARDFEQASAEHQRAIADRLLGRTGDAP